MNDWNGLVVWGYRAATVITIVRSAPRRICPSKRWNKFNFSCLSLAQRSTFKSKEWGVFGVWKPIQSNPTRVPKKVFLAVQNWRRGGETLFLKWYIHTSCVNRMRTEGSLHERKRLAKKGSREAGADKDTRLFFVGDLIWYKASWFILTLVFFFSSLSDSIPYFHHFISLHRLQHPGTVLWSMDYTCFAGKYRLEEEIANGGCGE